MATRYYESSTSGMNFDRFLDQFDDSTISKMKRKYWTAKQIIRSKLGQKEDDHLRASDSDLDAKLTLFHSVKKTSEEMLVCVEQYHSFIIDGAEAENGLGRYVKRVGRDERREHLSVCLTALGRALIFSAHRRAALHIPLLRFYDDMRVFYERALCDCQQTIEAVEKARTEYRGSLLWMQKSSQELDPESSTVMDNFREAQNVVRVNKEKLDSLKRDALQKIDLLSASRVNLLLHLLGSYAELLSAFYEKTSSAFSAIATNFTCCEHYDFEILTDLADGSSRIAKSAKGDAPSKERNGEQAEQEEDNLVDLTEYDVKMREYLFGRINPEEVEERAESPLAILDPSFSSSQEPTPSSSNLGIGPLPFSGRQTAEIPRLAPPPTHSSQLLDLSNETSATGKNCEWDTLLSECDLEDCPDTLI